MKVAVIGCSGAMGSYFVRRFIADGHDVTGSDIRRGTRLPAGLSFTSSNPGAVREADVTLFAVPIRDTVEVVREVSPRLKERSIAVEITSVKAKVRSELKLTLGRRAVRLISVHPLFGPLSAARNPKILVIGGAREASIADSLFPWADLIRLGEKEHDRAMAYALSLVHLLNLAFVSALKSGTGVGEFARMATPMGAAQLNIAKAVLSQDPSLYSYIQLENPYVVEAISSAIKELVRLRKIIAGKDAQEFEERFVSLSAEFGRRDLADALEKVYSASS